MKINEIITEGTGSLKPGWMLKQDPELAKKVKDSKRGHEARKKWAGKMVPKQNKEVTEGENLIDPEKEYGYDKRDIPQRRIPSGPSNPRRMHQDDTDFMDPIERRLRADRERVKKANAEHFAKKAEQDGQKGLAEGTDERKQNALWAQITAHEKAAKASKDLKRQHHLKMADQLRSQLKTSDNEQGVAEGQLEEDKGMKQYWAFKREWRTKHGTNAPVPAYDSKEYNSYCWAQGDKKKSVSETEYGMPGFNDEQVDETIKKVGSQYEVQSKSGKNMGKSPTKAGAVKRLGQVEYFKAHPKK